VAVEQSLGAADILIMAAAPADFRAAQPASRKIKKASAPSAIALAEAPDILLSTRSARNHGLVVVGFALETEDAVAGGREKLASKELDLIVVNDATEPGAGFGVDTNRVTLIDRQGIEDKLPILTKPDVADAILDRVEAMLSGR
jgi:phosphopantothenoylcysteine decarboxylase/phosphopantothenate--cysteine ligase